jgi:tetratricopeptide (TPR) repeat protein
MNPEPQQADRHLAPELMARLLSGRVESEELADVVLPHVLALCPECRAVKRELDSLRHAVGHWSYLVALTEGAEAPGLWSRLEALPYAEQLAAVDQEPAFQTWGLSRLLLGLSEQAACSEPAAAAQLASLALRIAEQLGDEYDADGVSDLRALAHAHLGDARRCLGELAAAADAFATAERFRAGGTGYAAVEADVLTREALLRRDRHQLSEAVALLDRAYAIYRGEGLPAVDPEAVEPHLAGRVRTQQAWCRYHAGQPELALTLLAEAESLVDRAREPRLLLAVHHGQVWAAILLGRLGEAESRLRLAIELASQQGDAADRLRLRRAQARIDQELKKRGPAEQAVRETFRELLEEGLGVDAALAVMDLADLYLKEGAADALNELGSEVFPAFSPALARAELPTPGVFALLLFQEACWANRLSPELLRGLAGLLERHRDASLSWWSSWGTVLSAETYPMPPLERPRRTEATE